VTSVAAAIHDQDELPDGPLSLPQASLLLTTQGSAEGASAKSQQSIFGWQGCVTSVAAAIHEQEPLMQYPTPHWVPNGREFGTNKTVKARLWLCLESFSGEKSLKIKLFEGKVFKTLSRLKHSVV